jgi:hypothetical protein
MPKWITKPAPITVNGAPATFDEFLTSLCDVQAVFGGGISSVRTGIKILEASSKAGPLGTFVLDEAEHQKLKAALDNGQWNPAAMRALMPFAVAIEEASSSAPLLAAAPDEASPS